MRKNSCEQKRLNYQRIVYNICVKSKFKALLFRCFITAVTALGCLSLQGQGQLIRGRTVESDSSSAMPFVYIISKRSGNGTMSDNRGRFSLITSSDDTLVCSYVGALKTKFPVRELARDSAGMVTLVLPQVGVDLMPVTVSTFKLKPYEREYMQEIIDRSKIDRMSVAQSPISALYMQFSREGKQIRKLAQIFEQIFIEEQVQKKLNKEILERLTGDSDIDFEAFRKYCYYVDDVFIMQHDGVELYTAVMECYRRYKKDLRYGR